VCARAFESSLDERAQFDVSVSCQLDTSVAASCSDVWALGVRASVTWTRAWLGLEGGGTFEGLRTMGTCGGVEFHGVWVFFWGRLNLCVCVCVCACPRV
jgi:hypothetical protein